MICGKVNVLRLKSSNGDSFNFEKALTASVGLPDMEPVPSDFLVFSHNENAFTVLFRKKKIDKKTLKKNVDEAVQEAKSAGLKVNKKALKAAILAEMLVDAPIIITNGEFEVHNGFVYITRLHKKVAELLFPYSFEVTKDFDGLNNLWKARSNPTKFVSVTHPEYAWTRTFKDDADPAFAISSAIDAALVTKFKDVTDAYALLNGRLVVSAEVDCEEAVDALYERAYADLEGSEGE